MNKSEIADRVNSLRENAKKNGCGENIKNPNEKRCPFNLEACDNRCKLFRENRQGYECPFLEIPTMSWNLKSVIKKLIG